MKSVTDTDRRTNGQNVILELHSFTTQILLRKIVERAKKTYLYKASRNEADWKQARSWVESIKFELHEVILWVESIISSYMKLY